MRLSKKISSLLLAAALTLGTSATVFAAPNDEVINALKNSKVPATYLIQAENYLKTTTITADQAQAVKAQIDKADAILENANVSDLSKLTDAQKDQIMAAITAAGQAVDLSISVSKQSNGTFAVTAKDSSGNVVGTLGSNQVKQTGANQMILVFGTGLLAAAAGSAFAIKKFKA